ncbi:MAG: hypothetical protein UT63_C0019G0018 [Candidatus Gottesmanbacteria bacterium GW2011_GWC2_39_8]|uniref:DUF4870 domain-containing protein n=1 Tax=Candidatus Gottesmanbacteria bacterium GW2011_GWC2_39_8 TaxID=1618450 RepID=A0A0G0Q7J1_9BACT|nr:MAG: hypothetical protein UT63_C0019G0018 [Candidatus Gottesmanbacteria bacterium GW2011_GWC2_39_8]
MTQNEKMMGALAYLLGPITGIALLLAEKKSEFVRFNAMQSTVVFGAYMVFYLVLGVIPVLGWILALILSPLLTLLAFVLWLVLMWKAFTGEKLKLPFAGEFAEKQLAKMNKSK